VFHARIVATILSVTLLMSFGGCGDPTPPDSDATHLFTGEAVKFFDNGNDDAVLNNPTEPTVFTTDKWYKITKITNYHWNDGAGAEPGAIGLRDSSGTGYGPWAAEGANNNVYWSCVPDQVLPPGTYTVEDSDPATWAQNVASGGCGLTWIEGIPEDGSGGDTAENNVSPSAGDQVIACGNDVTVMIPGGVLQSDQPLVVAPVTDPPAFNSSAYKIQTAYAITLGDLYDSEGRGLVVSCPYTPEGSEDPLDSYTGAYYDDATGYWVTLPSSLDTDGNRIFIHVPINVPETTESTASGKRATKEFSKLGIACINAMNTPDETRVIKHKAFTLRYNAKAAAIAAIAGAYQRDPNVEVLPDTDPYVSDTFHYLEAAYDTYRRNNFADLKYGDTEETVAIYDRYDMYVIEQRVITTHWTDTCITLEAGADPQTSAFGNITLGYEKETYQELMATCGHEMFHAFQHRVYWNHLFPYKTGKWWMEATAEMAGCRLLLGETVFGREPIMGGTASNQGDKRPNRVFWLQEPLDWASWSWITDVPHDEHEYTTGLFLAYLEAYEGVDFGDLWRTMAGYYTGTFLSGLDYYLKEKKVDLSDTYREYAEFFIFNAMSPVRSRLTVDSVTALSENSDKAKVMPESENRRSWSIPVEYYTGKLYRTPVGIDAPHVIRSMTIKRIDVPGETEATLSMDTAVYVWAASGGAIDAARKVGELTPKATATSFEVGVGEVVLFLVVTGKNSSALSSAPPFTVELTGGPAINSVTPSSFSERTPTTLSISGSNFGATQGASTVMIGTMTPGTAALTGVSWTSSLITGTTPGLGDGTYYVYVTVNGVTAASDAITVTPTAPPAGVVVSASGTANAKNDGIGQPGDANFAFSYNIQGTIADKYSPSANPAFVSKVGYRGSLGSGGTIVTIKVPYGGVPHFKGTFTLTDTSPTTWPEDWENYEDDGNRYSWLSAALGYGLTGFPSGPFSFKTLSSGTPIDVDIDESPFDFFAAGTFRVEAEHDSTDVQYPQYPDVQRILLLRIVSESP
jgi:hypothetical protein